MAEVNQGYQVDRTAALYERPALAIGDAATFTELKAAIESKFAAANVDSFLKSLAKSNLRIREFEAVAKAGKLGPSAAAQYEKLPVGDQALIRELYLASLEQVEQPLRDKYFKIYAYY